MNKRVDVIKQNISGAEVWRYSGDVLARSQNAVLLQAHFDRDDFLFNGMWLRRGDRFVEIYFSDRWYNIFEIYDREDGVLKGWYCNITQPASLKEGSITYVDMALDLLVFPDGRQQVLDLDEFESMGLSLSLRERSLSALADLQRIFKPPLQIDLVAMLRGHDGAPG